MFLLLTVPRLLYVEAFSSLLLPGPSRDCQVWMMEHKKIFDTGGMPKWEVRRFFLRDRSRAAYLDLIMFVCSCIRGC